MIISLDGNIGAGKTTLLEEIGKRLPVHIVNEPVSQWTALKNEEGKNLLELFYEDKKRWAYTFQNCAILTRFKSIQQAVENDHKIIITERSILTDRYVFAEMLKSVMDPLEWDLYESWFNIFGNKYPVNGIIYISTDPVTSKDRIKKRNRLGEDKIDMEYLDALDIQHKKWIKTTDIPVLTLSTESTIEHNIEEIRLFLSTHGNSV